jgi:8-oxo-dGTP diphosphatase
VSDDGNGWAVCALGHRHWGRFGAAGLLVTDGTGVLLQHRAAWTHEGDTWSVLGGARNREETALQAALREVSEESDLDLTAIEPVRSSIDDHGGWSYTTVLARSAGPVVVTDWNVESAAIRWWPIVEVDTLRLHHGFAAAWPGLRVLAGRMAASGTPPGTAPPQDLP